MSAGPGRARSQIVAIKPVASRPGGGKLSRNTKGPMTDKMNADLNLPEAAEDLAKTCKRADKTLEMLRLMALIQAFVITLYIVLDFYA